MLSWTAILSDLSPIKPIWNIIGQQIQRHPQPAWTVADLTDQVQQAWNSILQKDIWNLYNIIHACLHAFIQNHGKSKAVINASPYHI